jgi:asparagine synthase (glutamine-hydrolysing)
MSGIVGLFNLDGRPIDSSILAGLAAASRHRAIDGTDFWIDGPVGLGHQYSRVTLESQSEKQPFTSAGSSISFDGRLDNRGELLDCCEGPASQPDAALVLAAYRRFGVAFPSRLNGDFALAVADSSRGQVILACDAMGARSLYYSKVGRTLVFASEMKAILAYPGVKARPDADSLADLVLNGDQNPERTLLEGVLVVPPGFAILATPTGVRQQRCWSFEPRELRYGHVTEYVEHLQSLFDQSVQRRLRSVCPVAVSVSGGLDSSSILCTALARRGPGAAPARVHGVTMAFDPGTPADELQYIEAIESKYSIRIDRLRFSDLRLVLQDNSIDRLEIPRALWNAQVAVLEMARRRGCRVLLDGFFGDQMLSPSEYLLDLARSGRIGEVRRHLDEMQAWMTDVPPGVLRHQFWSGLARSFTRRLPFRDGAARIRTKGRYPKWYRPAFVERALDRAAARKNRQNHFASEHTRRCYDAATSGAYLAQTHHRRNSGLLHELDVTFPYRDRDLVAFLMNIPGEVINWRGVPKGLLRAAMHGVLPESIRRRRSKADFTRLSNRAVSAEVPRIVDLFQPDNLSVQLGFVDPFVLRSEATRLAPRLQRDDDATFGWQLTDAAALELWLRRFLAHRVMSHE